MKIIVHSLGCKVNQYEATALSNVLKSMGHKVSQKLGVADAYIIVTCAVTNEAERKSRQAVSKCLEYNSQAKIFVCGCASQNNAKQFENNKNVKYITGTANKLSIVKNLIKPKNQTEVFDLPTLYEEGLVANANEKVRVFIKIQDGCNNFCSYCLIPYLRGRSRSRSIMSIIQEVVDASTIAKEIVITGINISDYRIDGELALDKLLHELSVIPARLRLGSLECSLFSKQFIQNIKQVKNLCPHFHISLQNGCDSTLKAMNRKYTTSQFYEAIKLIKKEFKNPAITTDVIVGFPSETDANFKKSLAFIKKCGFSQIHIFPYSKRPGTVANKMKQIDGNIIKKRVKILEKLENKLNINYRKKCLNKKYNLLIEETKNNVSIGHTENYLKCYLLDTIAPNTMLDVIPIKIYKDGVIVKINNKK